MEYFGILVVSSESNIFNEDSELSAPIVPMAKLRLVDFSFAILSLSLSRRLSFHPTSIVNLETTQ